ncbi:hypothetical protein, partial [Microscilla marina]|uniref:hypothetical protein n=1 Tax=Microscilla marina TaxID=1027 RepID=UPI0005D46C77
MQQQTLFCAIRSSNAGKIDVDLIPAPRQNYLLVTEEALNDTLNCEYVELAFLCLSYAMLQGDNAYIYTDISALQLKRVAPNAWLEEFSLWEHSFWRDKAHLNIPQDHPHYQHKKVTYFEGKLLSIWTFMVKFENDSQIYTFTVQSEVEVLWVIHILQSYRDNKALGIQLDQSQKDIKDIQWLRASGNKFRVQGPFMGYPREIATSTSPTSFEVTTHLIKEAVLPMQVREGDSTQIFLMVNCPFLNDEVCILDSIEVTLRSVTKTNFFSAKLYEIMLLKNNNQQVFLGDTPCKFTSNF